jgi:hypothetical protein
VSPSGGSAIAISGALLNMQAKTKPTDLCT